MSKIKEVRADVDKLQKSIQTAVYKFVEDNGNCIINIDVDTTTINCKELGEVVMACDVKVSVTI